MAYRYGFWKKNFIVFITEKRCRRRLYSTKTIRNGYKQLRNKKKWESSHPTGCNYYQDNYRYWNCQLIIQDRKFIVMEGLALLYYSTKKNVQRLRIFATI